MLPCCGCHRHIREHESSCPFCGTHQGQVEAPWWTGGALALIGVLMVGSVACSPDQTSASETGASETDATQASETVGATTETSTETDTGDTADTSPDTSGSFYAPASDFQPVNECDPFLQDCPEGEKCVPYGSTGGNWDANKCVAVTGVGEPGDDCMSGGTVEATDDCDETSFCWDIMDIEGEGIGTCTPFCTGTADDPICGEGQDCLIANGGSISLCIDACGPLLQDCGEGFGCYWAETSFLCLLGNQDLEPGAPCGFLNDCAPGNLCLSADRQADCEGGSRCCVEFCDLEQPDPCPEPEQTCTAMFDEAGPAEYVELGLCIVPPP